MNWEEFMTPGTADFQSRPWSEIIEEFAAKHDRPIFGIERVGPNNGKTLTLEETIEVRHLWRTRQDLSVHDIANQFGVSIESIYRRVSSTRRSRR